MKHLDLELERLEQRIAPGGLGCKPKCGGGGGSSRSGGSKSHGSKNKSKSKGKKCK